MTFTEFKYISNFIRHCQRFGTCIINESHFAFGVNIKCFLKSLNLIYYRADSDKLENTIIIALLCENRRTGKRRRIA